MINLELLRLISLNLNNNDWCNFRLTCKLFYKVTNLDPQDYAARKLNYLFKQYLKIPKKKRILNKIKLYIKNNYATFMYLRPYPHYLGIIAPIKYQTNTYIIEHFKCNADGGFFDMPKNKKFIESHLYMECPFVTTLHYIEHHIEYILEAAHIAWCPHFDITLDDFIIFKSKYQRSGPKDDITADFFNKK